MSRSAPQSKAPRGYKFTDLGYIPEDWSITPLGQLIHSAEYGSSAKSDSKGEIPVLRMGNLQGGRIDWSDLVYTNNPREISRYSLQAGDVLFNRTNTIDLVGKTSLYEGAREAIFAGYLIRIKVVAEHLNARFLNYILNTPFARRHSLKELSLAVGQANINAQKLKTYPVPLPPAMKEQKAIAEALSDVDGLIGALEKLIAKKRAIKRAAVQQLLTAKTRLPGFSGKWETRRLEYFASIRNHKVLPSNVSPEMPCVELEHIGQGDGRLLARSTAKDSMSVKYSFQSGDVLFGRLRPYLRKFWLADCDGICTTEIWPLTVDPCQTVPSFLHILVQTDRFIDTASISYGTHMPRADWGVMRAFETRLPRVEEQQAIATVVSDIDAEIEALEHRRDKTRQIKQGMMQQLLTGRIRLVKPQAPTVQADAKSKESKPHSWAFNEAVVISTLARHFGKEEFPLGRKRYTKLSYLLHRHTEKQAEGYLKKAAGPYNPKTKYGGPERIALESGYVRDHKHGPYGGFVAADNIAQAEGYFEKWYGKNAIPWLERFRFKKNDDLELLATVDMAVEELRAAGNDVDVPGVKAVIRSHPEWKAKLDREVFSDANIRRAIDAVSELFAEQG
jgi:type I restriction enzyme S subunit